MTEESKGTQAKSKHHRQSDQRQNETCVIEEASQLPLHLQVVRLEVQTGIDYTDSPPETKEEEERENTHRIFENNEIQDLGLPEDHRIMKDERGFARLEPMTTGEAMVSTMKRVAKFLWRLTIFVLALAIPLYSYDLFMHGMEKHYIAWFSAGGFVLLTFPISMREIYNHLSHWYMPEVQRYVVRILWMVPVYSVESWLSLRFRDLSLYFETLRDGYEAYVMYSFVYFLLSLLGDEPTVARLLREKDSNLGKHPCPMNLCMRPWKMGRDFLYKVKFGVLQYVVLKNLMTALTFILVNVHAYDDGNLAWGKGYLYITAVNNFSQCWALYVLVKFYYATREELTNYRPMGKFLCVKMVVFATWWQSVIINIMRQSGMIKEVENFSQDDIANGLQNYLICIEMFIAALAHSIAFSYKDFIDDSSTAGTVRQHLMSAFVQSSVPADMLKDFRDAAKRPLRHRAHSGHRHHSNGRLHDMTVVQQMNAARFLLIMLMGMRGSVLPTTTAAVLRLGALFPVYKTSAFDYAFDSGGHNRFSGFYMAVREINNRTDGVLDHLHPNLTVAFSFHDTKRSEGHSFFAAADAAESDFDGEGVHAIVGAASSGPSASVATVAEQAQVPQISYSSSSPALSNKVDYPYFMRTTAADDYQAKAMAYVVNQFGWTNIVLISALDSYSSYGGTAVVGESEALGITIQKVQIISSEWESADIEAYLKIIMESGFKIMVMFIDAAVGYKVMMAAQDIGMVGMDSGYTWILSDSMLSTNLDNLEALLGDDLTGLLLFSPQSPSGSNYTAFEARYRGQPSTLGTCAVGQSVASCSCSSETDALGAPLFARDHDEDGGAATPALCAGWDFANDEINVYAPNAYDAVVVLANVASEMLYETGAIEGGPALLGRLRNFSAPTDASAAAAGLVTGPVGFDENGDRAAGLGISITNYDAAGTGNDVAVWTNEDGLVLSTTHSIQFANSNNTVPEDWSAPVCKVGEVLPTGSLVCITCSTGFFSWVPNEESCHECPLGARCIGGSDLRANFGYWRFPNTSGYCYDGAYEGCELYQCAFEQACLGDLSISPSASISVGSTMLYFSEPISAYKESAIKYYCLQDDGSYSSSCIFNIEGQDLLINSSATDAVSRTALKLASPYDDTVKGNILNSRLVLLMTEDCAPGYTGNGCAKCDSASNFRKEYSGMCSKCSQIGFVEWITFLLICICLLIAGLAVVKIKLRQSLKKKERVAILLKIFMSWGQTLAVFSSLGIGWPQPISLVFFTQEAIFNAGSSVVSLDCIFNHMGVALDESGEALPRAMVKVMFWLSLPIAVVSGSALFWMFVSWRRVRKIAKYNWDYDYYCDMGLLSVVKRGTVEAHDVKAILLCLGLNHHDVRVEEVIRVAGLKNKGIRYEKFQQQLIKATKSIYRGQAILTIVVLLFIVYPTVVTETLTLFKCVPLDTDALYLEIDLDFQCFTDKHILWIVFLGLPALFFYAVGIPAIAMNTLRRHRKELQNGNIRSRYNFLYDGYREQCYWWEGVVLLRKVAFIALGVSASQIGTTAVAVTGMIVALLVQVLQRHAQPFVDPSLNALEAASLRAALSTSICGLYFLQDSLTPGFEYVLILLIYAFNGHFLLTLFRLARKEKEHIVEAGDAVKKGWDKLAMRISHDHEKYRDAHIQHKYEHYLQGSQKRFAQQQAALLEAEIEAAEANRKAEHAKKSVLQLKKSQMVETEFIWKQAEAMAAQMPLFYLDQRKKLALTRHFSQRMVQCTQLFLNRPRYISSTTAAAEPDGSSAILELYNRNHRGRQQLDMVEEEKDVPMSSLLSSTLPELGGATVATDDAPIS